MNKRPFLILFLFLLLFSFGGQAADTYRPETSVAGLFRFPIAGDKYITSIRDGDSAKRYPGGGSCKFDDRSWEVVSTPHTVELCLPKAVVAAIIRALRGMQVFRSSHRNERTACTPSF